MEAPLKLTIAIDNTPTDKYLTRFVSILSQMLKVQELNFVHVADEEHPAQAQIESVVHEHLSPSLLSLCKIHILKGGVLKTLMEFLNTNDQDILVMGKKKGKLDNKFINKSPVSTVVVPEKFNEKIKNIVVPVDFSRGSSLAVNTALKLKTNSDSKVLLLNVYNVMPGYTRIGKTFRQAAENMKKAAEKDAEGFQKKYKINPSEVDFRYVLDDDAGPADKIYTFAKEKDADLVVIGSKGRTDAAAMLLGSIAEKVMNLDTGIPLWVVKKKGETLSFLDALFKI